MRNPKNIVRHELIGLHCLIVSSKNKSQENLEGKIIDETRNIIILSVKGIAKKIKKQGTIFRIFLGKKKVDINGSFLVAKPEDRIKKKIKKW